ncbi:hypothetical protein HJC23_013991 [Cyclotella cryptica]|uniref:Queuosine 5'-phosphate N-glycosylase/hydrolase n=1 Tax=Cyclotella cryptica TaxID=29204 RepID=A0ABD3NXX1_9STRA|eukprot:CCRYP_019234-RA/>CCRYP_019234-RA protein AED:0.41 eAED:0.41 QI:0/-1/0/1/-1/1/1/0/457
MTTGALVSFSPTASVRESCRLWMDHSKPCDDRLLEESDYPQNPKCSVSINSDALDRFSLEITNSILANKSLQVSEWDADGWHYTGKNYRAGVQSTSDRNVLMKMERVALYVLTMDAINFCFWPTSRKDSKNILEYEHLAIALRKVAEQDDGADKCDSTGSENICDDSSVVQSSPTYALSPTNLSKLTPQQLKDLLLPHLPQSHDEASEIISTHYEIPDINVRCHLLNELGHGLLEKHNASALHMISKANKSADALVGIILDTFPGFRDYIDGDVSSSHKWETSKKSSATVHFYKRAQIAVADLWASLGRCHKQSFALETSEKSSKLLTCCEFEDMDTITTFPDYRVPQILRHVNVLEYRDDLAHKVDSQIELDKGCMDEISIRAATVVAVEDLVSKVKQHLFSISSQSIDEKARGNMQAIANDVSAVTIDWYLWQQGEKLDRMNLMQPHHRVHTTFY